ncbi:hypothetical protein H7F15_05030 [Pontibacter sp. Tf4]|uniref:hypothetical protein n=1 Tax=Pontibacter sp. Tf4 TaxID=2761620 RepID=UPI001624E4CA|nr:hypothetical protein [Pontibacter sp. Tf4]MBB6610394.1 hypothetical protein [Pontibacter sp. Tf4]
MLHFTKVSTQGKDFNLIASGALAFKIHNKILKDEAFTTNTSMSRNMLVGSVPARKATSHNKSVFFVIISDLDKIDTESLSKMIREERAKGSYAVCQVIPMYYNELSFKALKMLRQNFDEVLELSKMNLGGGKLLMNMEQQHCLMTDYVVSMARIMFHVCANSSIPAKTVEERIEEPVFA